MTLDEISETFKIPLVKVKRLSKAGLLNCKQEDVRVRGMKNSLRCKNHLSVWHCLALIQEPALLSELGTYRERAESQLKALGKISGRGFGENSANLIFGAAILDVALTNDLAALVREKCERGISYHAIACRLLWDIQGPRQRQSANYVRKAITNLKNHPALQDWFVGVQTPLDL